MAFMKCNSHRARSRLLGVIGREAQSFYSFHDACHHGVYQVPDELMDRAKRLKGITKARNQSPDFWFMCWRLTPLATGSGT